MKRREKSGKGPAEKQENLGEKLKRVGKRGGHSTPVVPFWRLELQLQLQQQNLPLPLLAANSTSAAAHHHSRGGGGGGEEVERVQVTNAGVSPFQFPSVSARKLAATLWELHHYKLPLSRMHQGVGIAPPRIRRLHYHQHHQHHPYDDKGDLQHPDPSPSSPDLPGSASSLRRHVALLMQHHRPAERSNHALQPVSPASYGSSLEVAPYNPAISPSSSIGFRGRIGETSYSLKTSTELLKVLNRIWSLEEQHASNVSLVRELKKELDHARARIKELVRDQQADRQEIDELMKQIAEDKLARKSKEQDRINLAIQSVREELEDERKLRKRSESLHRKLARELHEVKMSFATALKELEKERKSRVLLEDLCDEFAWGIRDSEQELRALRQRYDKDWTEKAGHDHLVLHMSESWLDERMQMKLEHQNNLGGRTVVVDKLNSEIEAFLRAKRISKSNKNNHLPARDVKFRKSTLESTPLNVGVSAPQDEDDADDSAGSGSHCFELHKPSALEIKSQENDVEEDHIDDRLKQNQTKKLPSNDKTKSRSPASLQVKFEEQMARAVLHSESKDHFEDLDQRNSQALNPVEISISKRSEIGEATEEGSSVRRNKPDGTPEPNSNYMIDNLIRSHYLLSESGSTHPEKDYGLASGGSSVWRSRASPVRQWTERLPSNELEISESSSKLPPDLKENTLKAKLIEARTRSQRSRSRLKGSKVSF
ncbi:uncharacterized protein At5g41620-like [Coffea eugenioides]|uniref:uncharacterized protein At5g41620-like n=1 Tax=Coffea eugenioides TaxID=49369 RepID=UPI000F61482D|nr:uncharacterized protein At5g41620-like [Coffea eugenioides]